MSGTFPPTLPLKDQLKELHAAIRGELPGVARIALAIYNPKTDMLQTYVSL